MLLPLSLDSRGSSRLAVELGLGLVAQREDVLTEPGDALVTPRAPLVFKNEGCRFFGRYFRETARMVCEIAMEALREFQKSSSAISLSRKSLN